MSNQPSVTTPEMLVDKLIGTPYEFVKFVAQNISLVQLVARALKGADGTEAMLSRRTAIVRGSMGALGQTIAFSLPETIDFSKILDLSMTLTTTTGIRYLNDDRLFRSYVSGGDLLVELRAEAPTTLINSSMVAFLTLES